MYNIKCIFGLRNFGSNYINTRHNIGELYIKSLIQENNYKLKINKYLPGEIGFITLDGIMYSIVLPMTYMNNSGLIVKNYVKYFDIHIDNILIMHDDIDLPIGKIKYKFNGSHGGHNGVRDIIYHLNSSYFHRIRIGIGRPNNNKVKDYVLEKFSIYEQKIIKLSIIQHIEFIKKILSNAKYIKYK